MESYGEYCKHDVGAVINIHMIHLCDYRVFYNKTLTTIVLLMITTTTTIIIIIIIMCSYLLLSKTDQIKQ